MLKTLKLGKKVCDGLQRTTVQKRFFLSEAYRCEEAWKRRLESPLLQKINPADMFLELEQKYTTAGKVSAIDIDIFANIVVEEFQVEELLNLIHNLRLTAETSNSLDSMHHAVVRFLLNHDRTDDLINTLHDRLNYGIFPDHFCYNILMDTFIKREDYGRAAKIAVLPMLQEDSEHPITNALSIYSCHKYLENSDAWQKPPKEEDDSKEEIKIRIGYIKNPYFDDHFDLTDPKDLVGKTLAFQGKNINNVMGRTCQLRGLMLYRKYNNLSKLIQKWMEGIKGHIVHAEVFDLIANDNKNVSEEQVTDEYKELQSQLEKLKGSDQCKDSLTEVIKNNVMSAVNEQAEKDISHQCQKYVDWENVRQLVLNKQLEEIDRLSRIEKIKEIKNDLEERERILTFFEQEEEIELKIEQKELREQKEIKRVHNMHNSAKKLRKLIEAEVYVPPKI